MSTAGIIAVAFAAGYATGGLAMWLACRARVRPIMDELEKILRRSYELERDSEQRSEELGKLRARIHAMQADVEARTGGTP
jgi:hypothetical protein